MLLKVRKVQLLSILPSQDIQKNWLHSTIMSHPHPTTSLKVTCKTVIFLIFWLAIYKELFYFSKGSPPSQAIFKSILHVIPNIWHGEELLMDITAYDCIFLSYLLNAKNSVKLKFQVQNLFQNNWKK